MIRAIVDAAGIDGQTVVEIGPGAGALTGDLLARAKKLIANEKDGRLAALLQSRFGDALTLVHADFLDADDPRVHRRRPLHAVGNLPYYATTPIVLKLQSLLPASMTSWCSAKPPNGFSPHRRSCLRPVAVLTRCLYDAKTIFRRPGRVFYPAPEVDSVV